MEYYEPAEYSQRHHRRRKQSPLKDLATVFLLIVIAMLLCLMWPFSLHGVALPDVLGEIKYTGAQARMIGLYAQAMRKTSGAPSILPEEVGVFQPVEVGEWYVSEGTDDKLGNMCSVYNFFTTEWEAAQDWVLENVTVELHDGLPLERYRVPNFSPGFAAAIVANSVRESECLPCATENAVDLTGDAATIIARIRQYGSSSYRALGVLQLDGVRRTYFLEFCEKMNLHPLEMHTQLLYVTYEYLSPRGHGNWNYNGNDLSVYYQIPFERYEVAQAAEVFRRGWERGGTANLGTEILNNWHNKFEYSWGDKADYPGLFDFLYAYATTGRIPYKEV